MSLDSASLTIPSDHCKDSVPDRVDLPMRAFADGYYKNLKRMYDYFGIQYASPRFIYTLSSLPRIASDKIRPYFIHSSNNHQLPPSKPENNSWGSWLVELVYLTFCYYWFTACCFWIRPKINVESSVEESFRQYLERIGLPQYYIKYYLLPLISSVTTCSHDALLEFPAIDLVEYEKRTFRQPHYTIEGGVHKLQTKLSTGLKVRFRSTVTAVQNTRGKVKVTMRDEHTGFLDSALFDHVIMAVTPDVVGLIFPPLESVMAAVPTTRVLSVVHHDYTRFSTCRQYVRGRIPFDHRGRASQPIHMCSNAYATESTHEHPCSVLITTSPIISVRPTHILHSVTFTRVLRTPTSRQLLNRVFGANELECRDDNLKSCWRNGDGNVWLVGGWCWDGMVMLEGCVASAIRVADSLGVEVPWLLGYSYDQCCNAR